MTTETHSYTVTREFTFVVPFVCFGAAERWPDRYSYGRENDLEDTRPAPWFGYRAGADDSDWAFVWLGRWVISLRGWSYGVEAALR